MTHLKSSQGSAGAGDHEYAKKRELVAAAMAKFVADKLSSMVVGDLNVGGTHRAKNGFQLKVDKVTAARDLDVDEYHSLYWPHRRARMSERRGS
jgi:hypothetical protein